MGLKELYGNDSYIACNLFDFSLLTVKNALEKALYYKHLESELRGKHLKIATMQNGALSGAIKVNDTWIGDGIAFELVKLLQEMFDFEYSIIVPLENSLGSKDDGIFGLVYNEKVDLAAAFLPMTTIYWEYVDFATYLDVGNWVGILKRPNESGTGAGIFAPFAIDVWIVIILLIFIVGSMIYAILHTYSAFNRQSKKYNSFQDCLLFAYSALLKQSSTLRPTSDSSRLAFTTWWVFIMIITAFYTANLTAFLTLSETKLPIKNTHDIITKRYSLISKTGTVIQETTMNDLETLHDIFKTSKKVFVEEDDDFILNWIKNQNFIYLAEKPNIDIVLYKNYLKYFNTDTPQTERCAFVATSWTIYRWPRSFAYSKNFKFGPLFDRALRSFVEVGLVKYNFNKYLPVTNFCPLNLQNHERSLSSADFLITYNILLGGFVLSLLIFILEIVFFMLKRKINKRLKIKRVNVKRRHVQLDVNRLYLRSLEYSAILKKKHINGRDYWLTTFKGEIRLIPIRTPSAIIFHANIEDICK